MTSRDSGGSGLTGPEEGRLLRLLGLALPAAVWVLGVVPPPRDGLTPSYLVTFTGLLVALALVDGTAPRVASARWQRLLWLGAELVLCFLVVTVQGTLVRPALIYLLPASRALLMFNQPAGLALSFCVWLVYGLNVGLYAWPDRLHEYPNYLTFFLGPYVIAVLLTHALVRQYADRRRLQALYDELRRAHEQLQALHQQARELAVTQERNRLAREIHDSLAHYLTVINVQLEAAEKLAPDQADRALEQVRRARRLAVECLQETRRSVAALRAATLEELSLDKALHRLATEFAESTAIEVQLQIGVPDRMRLPPELTLALYRAAQEGLTNVHRHARASRVRLSLTVHNGSVELSVQDDGLGPPPAGAGGDEDGFGLLGLRERVELLGGRLTFGPAAGGGSRLAVVLPAT